MTHGHESAWGHSIQTSDGITLVHFGLTKREYFAALFMAGALENPNWDSSELGMIPFAEDAVLQADALIKALNVPMCPDCKQSNANGHYDAEHKICPAYEQAWADHHVEVV